MIPILLKRIVILGVISIWRHRLRSFLTILGIVFGVCSVIAMLAIGEGASEEALEEIEKLGSKNIILRSVKPPESESVGQETTFVLDYGLTYKDADRIKSTIPSVEVIVLQRTIRIDVQYRRRKVDADLIGTLPWYPEIARRRVRSGRFINETEMRDRKNVCVLSAELAKKLFPFEYPINNVIKVQADYYRVIGVMEAVGGRPGTESSTLLNLFIPLSTVKSRFGETIRRRSSGSFTSEKVELHEIIVRVKGKGSDTSLVIPTAEIIEAILKQGHKETDYEVVVPLELLRQAEKTKRIFNIVLGSIAAISLLVGGIGIMNIMLASVTERTREIGIRRALGAKQRDIVTQFMTETILLSGCGGIIGLILGITIPMLVEHFAGMKTIITMWSLTGAFGISVCIGLIFGIYPAYRASTMNPITALRHE